MKNLSLICILIFGFVLSWSGVMAEDGFYVIAVKPAMQNSYAAAIPKTGQTISYTSNDDGKLQNGVAWPDPRFTDNGDGTVTDKLTGLIWLKDLTCIGLGEWLDAFNECDALKSGDCGLTDGSSEGDWRLPNIRELYSLIDLGNYNMALPQGHPFIGIQYTSYWSSSTAAHHTLSSWTVFAHNGTVSILAKANLTRFWPVRGGN
ncbi:DUF1566 domain-containing protein [bacterium]|nr:DUF1566 domain-containing protein [bacterium]